MVALLWIGFVAFVLVMLALDLGVFNRKAHVISTREALRWTGLCAALALVFTLFVYFAYEHHLLGIGYVLVVRPAAQAGVVAHFHRQGIKAVVIGKIRKGSDGVELK